MKLLNYGSLNYDYVYEIPHFVQPGETLRAKSRTQFPGGKGLNQSIALAKAGAEVYHAGMVGLDGMPLIQLCTEYGIHTEFIETVEDVSGHAIIQLDESGENSILLYEGANGRNSEQQIDRVLNEFLKDDLLLIQNEVNELEYLTQKSYEKGMQIILNPSPFNERLTEAIFSRVSLFLMNEIEGYQITGEKEPHAILKVMRERYPNAGVLLTLGKKGSIYQKEDMIVECKGYEVAAVDTTAAGDTYTGFFLASIQKGMPVAEAMETASAASALAVMKKGAAVSIPTLQEVELASFRIR